MTDQLVLLREQPGSEEPDISSDAILVGSANIIEITQLRYQISVTKVVSAKASCWPMAEPGL